MQTTPTHPSHSQPKCVDCKHFAQIPNGSRSRFDHCHHPVNGVDLVRGEPNAPACHLLRDWPAESVDKCGQEGRWFESSTDCDSSSSAAVKP